MRWDSESNIEVYGQSIDAIVAGFALFPEIGMEKLMAHGIGARKSSGGGTRLEEDRCEIVVDRSRWYSQRDWLAAFADLAEALGGNVLFRIGRQVHRYAIFPGAAMPGNDIVQGLQALDLAYHMNHRKDGVVMYQPMTNTMLEGIGHYTVLRSQQEKQLMVHCQNPYPCDFDRGVLQGLAQQYEGTAEVMHDSKAPCRKRAADACTYIITW